MQFIDLINKYPNWTLVDFYVDQGQAAPKMENAPEWCRLLNDCFNKKVDLIITHKVSNVSRDANELTLCARLLAAQPHPVGMYYIGEDIYTLASYYLQDLRDAQFFPTEDWACLPDDDEDQLVVPERTNGGLLT